MIKDDADAILEQARLLLEEDVSCETRCRIARKIIERAKAIKAVCMDGPKYTLQAKQGPITVTPPVPVPQDDDALFTPTAYGYAGFRPVLIKYSDWLNPGPEHEGERILWADGSAHTMPEADTEYVTVLRRVEPEISVHLHIGQLPSYSRQQVLEGSGCVLMADDQESRKTANACMMRWNRWAEDAPILLNHDGEIKRIPPNYG